MLRDTSLLFLIFVASASAVFPQRHLPGEDEKVRIEKKATGVPAAQPKGSRVAQKRTNAVLFVLTEPAEALVLIKSRGAVVKQGQSEDGEFRTELSPGTYDVEVTSAKHVSFTGKATVKTGEPKILPVGLTPTTGSILVGPVEPDVDISIDGAKPANIKIYKAENQVEIEEILAGFHSLRITHPTIADWEVEKIEVRGGFRSYIAPKFKPAIVNLIVRSEPGAEIYVDGTYKGEVAETGRTGALQVAPGRHLIRAVKGEYSPAEHEGSFAAGDAEIEIKLSRIAFSPEFSDYFVEGTRFWTVPSTWQVSRGNALVRGQGVGLVRDKVYKDFTMEFDVRFSNGRGAAWVVRARDNKNFYLFQLTGPRSGTPNTFRSYLCQDGQMKLLKTDFVAEDLSRPNDSFHIIVEARGGTIKHSIQVKSAPKADGAQPLSTLSDQSLAYGTVGFGTADNEEAVVYFVSVVPVN